MGANRTEKQFRSRTHPNFTAEHIKQIRSIGGVFCVCGLIHFGFRAVLTGIVNDTGADNIVLVFLTHIGVRGHFQQFFGEHYNRFGMANQTAVALGENGVILAGRGSANLPEVLRYPRIQIFPGHISQDRVFDKGQLAFKMFGLHHSLFSFVRATALLITCLV